MLLLTKQPHLPLSSFLTRLLLFLTWCPGSCRPHRTAALWAAGSSPAGGSDPPSSRCSPAGGGLMSGCTLLRTTEDAKKKRCWAPQNGSQCVCVSEQRIRHWCLPRCLQTRSTVGSALRWGSWRRRTCCCRRLHTHSLGNNAEEKNENDCFYVSDWRKPFCRAAMRI